MSVLAHYAISGRTASEVAGAVERAVDAGRLGPGTRLPSVRAMADELALSPATVASAIRDLRQRGVLVTRERSGTVVAERPPLPVRGDPEVPEGAVDLMTGNPDLALLPDPAAVSGTLRQVGYGEVAVLPALRAAAAAALERDGVPAEHLCVVSGAMDGVERVLGAHLRPGDAVAVEDPGYVGVIDLARAMGFTTVPVAVDDEGLLPRALEAAVERGARAVVLSPRAQNPTGAALSEERAAQLRPVLARAAEVLVVEDDHAVEVAGAPCVSLATGRERWAVLRSVGKTLGPDLRLALLAGDAVTVSRVSGRQRLGCGWVSLHLQGIAAALLSDHAVGRQLQAAAAVYTARRAALLKALTSEGIPAHGRSGLNVWVPVTEEQPVVRGMAARGWAIRAGEPYRHGARPAVRITTASLPEADAARVAADLAAVIHPASHRTRTT